MFNAVWGVLRVRGFPAAVIGQRRRCARAKIETANTKHRSPSPTTTDDRLAALQHLSSSTLLHAHDTRTLQFRLLRSCYLTHPAKMFRSAVSRSLRAASIPRVVSKRTPGFLQVPKSSVARPSQFVPCFSCQAVRSYSAPAGLTKTEVEGRIVDLLKNFDKVYR